MRSNILHLNYYLYFELSSLISFTTQFARSLFRCALVASLLANEIQKSKNDAKLPVLKRSGDIGGAGNRILE